MKTANDVIGDLEQLVAKLRGELREAGERTDRLRDERDTARLALREAKSEPEDVQLDVELEKRIAEIRERESKATKGPWNWRENEEHGREPQVWADHYPNGEFAATEGSRGWSICKTRPKSLTKHSVLWPFPFGEHGWEDGQFIAHARADIPFLLEQLALLRRVSGKGARPEITLGVPVEGSCNGEPAQVAFFSKEASEAYGFKVSPAPVPDTPDDPERDADESYSECSENADYEEGSEAVFLLRKQLPNLDRFIKDVAVEEIERATTQGTPEGAK